MRRSAFGASWRGNSFPPARNLRLSLRLPHLRSGTIAPHPTTRCGWTIPIRFAHGRCETASPDIGERDAPTDSAKKRSAAKLACTGRIRKQGTDHYLVSIDGRVHLLRQGQRAGDFTLRQVRNDSLVMARDTECYLVKVP
ncbi:MAG: hypothetical protein ACLR8Y_15990 [Alistipes indistinctus]